MMRASAWRSLLVAGAFALLAAGCASQFQLEAPNLSVLSIKMQSADIFSQRVLVRMRVQNPNARALPIKGITYRIEVNGAELADGSSDTPFEVPAMGEAEFDAQLNANLASALAQFLSRKGSDNAVEYRLVGSVALSSGFLRRIPFDERGRIDLK